MVLQRLLRAGEGKMVRRLKSIADAVNNVEEDFLSTAVSFESAAGLLFSFVPTSSSVPIPLICRFVQPSSARCQE